MRDLHVPSHIRRSIGAPPAAIYVRFGTESNRGPGSYEFEISPADRKILEQAISDSKSPDKIRQAAAREGLLSGLRVGASPLTRLIAFGAEQIMNLLGFGVLASFGDAKTPIRHGYLSSDETCGNSGDISASAAVGSLSFEPHADGTDTLTINGLFQHLRAADFEEYSFFNFWRVDTRAGAIGYQLVAPGVSRTQLFVGGRFSEDIQGGDKPGCDIVHEFPTRESLTQDRLELAEGKESGTIRWYIQDHLDNASRVYGPIIEWTRGAGEFGDIPELTNLEDMEPIGALDPALSDVTPTEMQDLIDNLKDPANPYSDYIGKPESDPGDVRLPSPGDTPTPEPGEIPAPNPVLPGLDPADPGFPCSPDMGTPLDNLKLDRDLGLGDLARFDMPLPSDAFGPGDPLRQEPPALPGDSFDPDEFPGGGFPDRGFPKPGFRPGDPLNVGVGPDDGFGGKIGKFEPRDPPGLGDIIGTAPPFADETFTKPRCYKNRLITGIVRDLAVELGMNPETTFVREGCDKRFTGCFKKGSSKFDAMWDLADRCGYGVFPNPGDGGGTIEEITPLPVHHGPYHEDRNLFVFDPVYDDFEVFSHVEVSRPAYRNRPGYSVVLPVNPIYSVPEDKWETKVVGPSVTEADAMDMAARRVRELRRRTLRIEVAVPYDPRIMPRHQAIISRPLRRFRQNYMVTGLRHDLDRKGWLTILSGVHLDAEETARYR